MLILFSLFLIKKGIEQGGGADNGWIPIGIIYLAIGLGIFLQRELARISNTLVSIFAILLSWQIFVKGGATDAGIIYFVCLSIFLIMFLELPSVKKEFK